MNNWIFWAPVIDRNDLRNAAGIVLSQGHPFWRFGELRFVLSKVLSIVLTLTDWIGFSEMQPIDPKLKMVLVWATALPRASHRAHY